MEDEKKQFGVQLCARTVKNSRLINVSLKVPDRKKPLFVFQTTYKNWNNIFMRGFIFMDLRKKNESRLIKGYDMKKKIIKQNYAYKKAKENLSKANL